MKQTLVEFSALLFVVLSHVSPTLAKDIQCQAPQNFVDIVQCQNAFATAGQSSIAKFISSLASSAGVGCTRSRMSAQPAYPELNDLRCFLVFSSGVTMSFNLVSGLNEDHIEVSEPYDSHQGQSGVLLGHFKLDQHLTIETLLESSVQPLFNGRLTCASCHRPLGLEPVAAHGLSAILLKPIQINRMINGRRAVDGRGQIGPELLDEELSSLFRRHECIETLSRTSETETCARIRELRNIPRKISLQD